VTTALGHASATTTLSTYAHLSPTAEDRSRNAAEAMFSEALAEDSDNSADSTRNSGVLEPFDLGVSA